MAPSSSQSDQRHSYDRRLCFLESCDSLRLSESCYPRCQGLTFHGFQTKRPQIVLSVANRSSIQQGSNSSYGRFQPSRRQKSGTKVLASCSQRGQLCLVFLLIRWPVPGLLELTWQLWQLHYRSAWTNQVGLRGACSTFTACSPHCWFLWSRHLLHPTVFPNCAASSGSRTHRSTSSQSGRFGGARTWRGEHLSLSRPTATGPLCAVGPDCNNGCDFAEHLWSSSKIWCFHLYSWV